MDMMKEFKDVAVEELKAIYHDLSKEIYNMRNQVRMTRKLDKPHLLRKKKRDRARVMTLLSMKGEKV